MSQLWVLLEDDGCLAGRDVFGDNGAGADGFEFDFCFHISIFRWLVVGGQGRRGD